MQKPYATFDRSKRPLMLVRFTGEKAIQDTFDLYLFELKKNYDNHENIVIIFDARKAGIPKLKYQQKQASWMKQNDEMIRKYCFGIAYVIKNNLIRSTLNFILSIYNNPVPFKVFTSVDEAERWCIEKLPSQEDLKS